jgi:hypothetical protein
MAYKHKKNCIEKKALAAAKELEKIPMPTEKDIVKIYKQGMEEAQRLQKLLKPEWFVKDEDNAGKAGKPVRVPRPGKPAKKRKKK